MKIILEGADGVGKTTLAKIFAAKFGMETAHCTWNDPADYCFYRQTLKKENMIWDRHALSELVYPYIFDRRPQIGVEDGRLLMHYAKQEGVKVFVLTCNEMTLEQRLCERSNEHPKILDNIGLINSQFIKYAKEFRIPIIDISKMTLNEIFNLIEDGKEKGEVA